MKKGICSLLVVLLTLTTIAPTFAMEKQKGELETIMCDGVNIVTSIADEDRQPVSNRYTFITEKGTEHLRSTTTYTKSQINTQAKIKAIVENMTGFMEDVPGAYADLLIATFYEVHQFGTAARVKIYSRLDKRYRKDSVTGAKTSAGSRYVYTYKFYTRNDDGSYKLYKTRVFSQANFR